MRDEISTDAGHVAVQESTRDKRSEVVSAIWVDLGPPYLVDGDGVRSCGSPPYLFDGDGVHSFDNASPYSRCF